MINSNEFKLILGSDNDSEEEYSVNGFLEQGLIMGDTSSLSKKHSKTKGTPTTIGRHSVQENMEATPQGEHCVRSCERQPKLKQKSLKRFVPNGLIRIIKNCNHKI